MTKELDKFIHDTALVLMKRSPMAEREDLIQEGYLAVLLLARRKHLDTDSEINTNYLGECARHRMQKYARKESGYHKKFVSLDVIADASYEMEDPA